MLAMHLIFGAYGFWLPNDPRGSWSTFVRAYHLYKAAGDATKVSTRDSLAAQPHDHHARLAAKQHLARPAVTFNGLQARAIARGVALVVPKIELQVFAFSIMPDHVHTVVGAHSMDGQEVIACLKRAGTKRLNREGLHPFRDRPRSNGKFPSPWAEGGWVVFLDTVSEVRSRIKYVEENPLKAGLKPQRWSFVAPLEG
jgi:REP element-mobilizing transposase RayT